MLLPVRIPTFQQKPLAQIRLILGQVQVSHKNIFCQLGKNPLQPTVCFLVIPTLYKPPSIQSTTESCQYLAYFDWRLTEDTNPLKFKDYWTKDSYRGTRNPLLTATVKAIVS